MSKTKKGNNKKTNNQETATASFIIKTTFKILGVFVGMAILIAIIVFITDGGGNDSKGVSCAKELLNNIYVIPDNSLKCYGTGGYYSIKCEYVHGDISEYYYFTYYDEAVHYEKIETYKGNMLTYDNVFYGKKIKCS